MKRIIQIIMCGACSAAIIHSAHAESAVEQCRRGVVLLTVPKQAYETVNNTPQELWYRNPIDQQYTRKQIATIGTGFFLRHSNSTYIVTAKHVVVDDLGLIAEGGEVWVNIVSNRATALKISEMDKAGHRWFVHPTADIAVHPYFYPSNLQVSASDFMESFIDTNVTAMLSPVFAVGFPMGLGFGNMMEPVAKRCQISAPQITLENNPNAPPYILLDEALAQGYSGSPVFTDIPPMVMQHEYKLVAVMSAVRSDISGGKVSYCVPIAAVYDIFQSDEFIKYEAQQEKAHTPSNP